MHHATAHRRLYVIVNIPRLAEIHIEYELVRPVTLSLDIRIIANISGCMNFDRY